MSYRGPITLGLVSLAVVGCAEVPKPQSTFGKQVYAVMLRHEEAQGIVDISDELCGTFNEEDLAVAVEEMAELEPFTAASGFPVGPEGTTIATFKRSVGWPWTQTLYVELQSDQGHCEVQIGRRST